MPNLNKIKQKKPRKKQIKNPVPFNAKKVLIHSNHCKALTGFGKNAKNILIHLHKTGKYEIVEFSNGKKWADPSLKQLLEMHRIITVAKNDRNTKQRSIYGAECSLWIRDD